MSTLAPVYLPPLNQEAALQLSVEIDGLLGQINNHELKLARSYARLGGLLREVKVQQYWMAYGYDRFSSYLEFIRNKIGRERSQVYAILSVSETLLPLMSEEQLEKIGVTKAHQLKRLVQQGGNLNAVIDEPEHSGHPRPDSVSLLDYAARPNVTALQLRAAVNDLLHIKEGPKGQWFEFGAGYLTSDEKKELDTFWGLGRRVLQLEGEQAEHVWRTQVMMAAVRECLGAWVNEVD